MTSVAFVFPGQGSQHVGMLDAMAAAFPVVQDVVDEASSVLGYDMMALCQDNPDDKLNQTEYTQPALMTASVAFWRAFQSCSDLTPSFMAGHSLGEYAALVCAGSIAFADGLTLVAARGKYMQEAVPEGQGALAAIIGMDDDAVASMCAEMSEGEVLTPANYNTPGQVVIAGTMSSVNRVVAVAKEKGAKLAKLLPVSVPSHSALMAPAAEKLSSVLKAMTVNAPSIPVVNNVDVAVCSDPDAIRDALLRQLVSPVQWVKTVNYLSSQKVDCLVECGPGKVLTGLNKRIDRNLTLTSICDPDTLSQSIEQLT